MPGIIVTYTERQIQHMSVPEGTLHSSTGLAMPWERHHDEALAALTRPTLKQSATASSGGLLPGQKVITPKLLAATIIIENASDDTSYGIRLAMNKHVAINQKLVCQHVAVTTRVK